VSEAAFEAVHAFAPGFAVGFGHPGS
jgi:hypothetical protein